MAKRPGNKLATLGDQLAIKDPELAEDFATGNLDLDGSSDDDAGDGMEAASGAFDDDSSEDAPESSEDPTAAEQEPQKLSKVRPSDLRAKAEERSQAIRVDRALGDLLASPKRLLELYETDGSFRSVVDAILRDEEAERARVEEQLSQLRERAKLLGISVDWTRETAQQRTYAPIGAAPKAKRARSEKAPGEGARRGRVAADTTELQTRILGHIQASDGWLSALDLKPRIVAELGEAFNVSQYSSAIHALLSDGKIQVAGVKRGARYALA